MLKKFGLEDSKPTKTPMSIEIKLTKDNEADSVDSSQYRGMIGSLLYLTASWPDIMFSVCLCSRFQENPKTIHLEAIKHIFRYIRGTSHLGLWYPKGVRIETIVYADSDHAGDYIDRKSTSGICTIIGYCLTSWLAKKQTALSISMTECRQALWMKQALIDYEIRLGDVSIMCDNKDFKRKTARMSVKYPNYVNLTSSSEERPNERTPSPPPRKKSFSPPQAPSKLISSKSTHYTSSSSPSESPTSTHVAPPPKLRFVISIKQEPQELPPLQMSPNDPYTQTMDNWPAGPSNSSLPLHVS
uniref:Retrovirus-related Pol polyprotein from transposon TNT 1-94 n=1 Tax=Tanacetum cinerariifolium TaxID=118510 RepID=A0A6L2LSM5_TANCI|nr:retrovirus-related Pol polyprotein from transposon TNT 1-94 [Tanacetum cinerariifolium]